MKYILKSDIVEVIPFHRDTLDQVKLLCPDIRLIRNRHPEGRLIGVSDTLNLKLTEGDYLVLTKDYELQAVSPFIFHALYQPVTTGFCLAPEEQILIKVALQQLAIEKRQEGWQADAKNQRYVASQCFQMANHLIDLLHKLEQLKGEIC